ncbi:MAG TPA: GNAT family N-acetyltransferase [Burkholderiaceae bacterium]|nr:GNAT family N-acetyltransferase [Burkholderiaceae bacterium]HMY98480.1 GNAT family N-acetyltransferase [Burkholderiaceae bacterium]HNG78099.1 GNAT family N-acetyltransferase [Burkholderiaceae bacterium]
MIAPTNSHSTAGPSASAAEVRLVDLPPLGALEATWRDLENRADSSFFTSWDWIGPWLHCLPEDVRPRLLRADHAGQCVGLALLVERRHLRFGFLPVRAMHFNESGRADLDALTIEYNGCLTARDSGAGSAADIERAMLLALMATPQAPDELRLSGARRLLEDLPANLQQRATPHLCFYIDLQAINASGKDYLGYLKQRQRYLVRKSLKRLSDPVPLRMVQATTLEQAREFLAELERLHTRYWQAKGEPGAFGSDFQRRFHTHLIEQGMPRGAVALTAAMRGDRAIAYFYYFCHDGWVHYYQSGIDYEQLDGSESPGLAAHALAVEHFRTAGWRFYDFMTGDLQYKRTLATEDLPLHWVTLQQHSAKMRLEDWLLRQAKAGRARWRHWRDERQARQQRQASERAEATAAAAAGQAAASPASVAQVREPHSG